MASGSSNEVRVFAPATVANVACGYDVLGFAIEAPGDEIVARHSDKPGLRIVEITGDDGKLPKEVEKNTAGVAAQDLLRHLGMLDRGIELEVPQEDALRERPGIECGQRGGRERMRSTS